MKLIVTIDTEEDNWSRYSAIHNSVQNIMQINKLQALFDEFRVTPTYLVSYPVAANPESVALLRRILEDGRCEIGMHCHPWNTPPLDEKMDIEKHSTMLCNLSEDLQYMKLACLHDRICKSFGIVPVSFRAGRWGFAAGLARPLCKLGYRIDTSVTPFVSWRDYGGPDFSDFGPEPFPIYPEALPEQSAELRLLQVPVSIYFLQSNIRLCRWLAKATETRLARTCHTKGILDWVGLVNKVWLSPELVDGETMIKLAKKMHMEHFSCLNMTFHSNSLMRGLNPFISTAEDEKKFLERIRSFLIYARDAGFESRTLSQFSEDFSALIR